MAREIIAVYQDCVLCGTKGRRKIADYAARGIRIRKVGFTTPEGKELIHKAVFEHKIGSMPFYTDGKKFASTIDELLDTEQFIRHATPDEAKALDRAYANRFPKEPKIAKKLQKKVVLEKKSKITERKVESNGALAAN